MLAMVRLTRGTVRIGEVWYDEEPEADIDVVRHRQRTRPVVGARCSEFQTPFIDLTRSEDALFADIKSDARTKIRRATAKDRVTCRAFEGAAASRTDATFVTFFNEFARGKGLGTITAALLGAYAEAGVLDLSCASVEGDEAQLVWHAHYRSATHARLLHSASLYRASSDPGFRNLVGRANRLLHWADVRRFKAGGLRVYDFGGWYGGDSDAEKLSINRFKAEFGGRIVQTFDCERGVSPRGVLFVEAKRLRAASSELLGRVSVVRDRLARTLRAALPPRWVGSSTR
jgi:hypothetical protein